MTRTVFVTGGAGFIGGAVARPLRARGDDVVAVVRDPSKAADLRETGVRLIAGDLGTADAVREAIRGCDAVIHIAGMYEVGVPGSRRPAMYAANVTLTERVLDAAIAEGIGRIVYISTVNVFGNTHGRVVDESYRRDLGDGFLSWYDETKYRAHEIAEARIAAGAPIVIAMPSQVYGPNDHSTFGEQLALAHAGRLRYRALDDVGAGLVHVDDLAGGIVAALDGGSIGRSYVLSGPRTTLRDAIGLAAKVGGREPPALRLPTGLLRVMAPLGVLIGQRNLREVIASSSGVTYWATADRAKAELGWQAREIEAGFRDMFATA